MLPAIYRPPLQNWVEGSINDHLVWKGIRFKLFWSQCQWWEVRIIMLTILLRLWASIKSTLIGHLIRRTLPNQRQLLRAIPWTIWRVFFKLSKICIRRSQEISSLRLVILWNTAKSISTKSLNLRNRTQIQIPSRTELQNMHSSTLKSGDKRRKLRPNLPDHSQQLKQLRNQKKMRQVKSIKMNYLICSMQDKACKICQHSKLRWFLLGRRVETSLNGECQTPFQWTEEDLLWKNQALKSLQCLAVIIKVYRPSFALKAHLPFIIITNWRVKNTMKIQSWLNLRPNKDFRSNLMTSDRERSMKRSYSLSRS